MLSKKIIGIIRKNELNHKKRKIWARNFKKRHVKKEKFVKKNWNLKRNGLEWLNSKWSFQSQN